MRKFTADYKAPKANTPILLSDLLMYSHYYKENRFFSSLKKAARKVGKEATMKLLLLYYLFKSDKVSNYSKLLLLASLGYFISPIDLIPDFLVPIIGFTDDLAVAELILYTLRSSLTDEIRRLAESRTRQIFEAR